MGRLRTALAVVAAVLIVAAGVWITIKAVDKDPALFGSVVAAAVAFGLAVAQRRWEKRQELERLHRDEMAPIYEQLVDRLKDEEKMAATAENAEFFKELTTKLLVHGSPPVIKAWIGWRETGTPQSPEDLRLVLAWEGVLRTIRADLGHDDSSLAYGDLLRVYINDVDEALALIHRCSVGVVRGADLNDLLSRQKAVVSGDGGPATGGHLHGERSAGRDEGAVR